MSRTTTRKRRLLGLLLLLFALALAITLTMPPPPLNITYPHGRGVWFYWSKDPAILNHTTVDDLRERGISTIYFSAVAPEKIYDVATTAKTRDFIAYARTQQMNVFGVIFQDPLFALKNESDLLRSFNLIIDQNAGLYDGYIADIEPHVISRIYPQYTPFGQDLNTTKYYLDNYVRRSRLLAAAAKDRGVLFANTVPYWYHSRLHSVGYDDGIDAFQGDFIILMVYANTSSGVLGRAADSVHNATLKQVIGINVRPGGDPYLTGDELPLFWRSLPAYLADNPIVIGTAVFDARNLLTQSTSQYVGGT